MSRIRVLGITDRMIEDYGYDSFDDMMAKNKTAWMCVFPKLTGQDSRLNTTYLADYVYYQYEDGNRYYLKNRFNGSTGLHTPSEYEEFDMKNFAVSLSFIDHHTNNIISSVAVFAAGKTKNDACDQALTHPRAVSMVKNGNVLAHWDAEEFPFGRAVDES